MKKMIMSAMYTRMNTSKDTYISDANAVEDKLQKRSQDLEKVIRTCYDKMNEILELLEDVNLDEYWYDEDDTALDAPDDLDWFDNVSDDEVAKYYNAYDDAWSVGGKVAELCKHGQKIKEALKEFK